MTELLTAAQMRAIEEAAIASGEVTGLELMERAGRGVVEAIFEEWPELAETSHRAVVLCGPGNNGGDGFVVARLLKEWGWEVEVFLYGDPEKLPPDARENYERWWALGEVRALELFDAHQYSPVRTGEPTRTWIIDALFGTGLSRPMEGVAAQRVKELGRANLGQRPAIISVDIPSGICSDSGVELGVSLPADQIVTFHLPKLGHHLSAGARRSFSLSIKSIGIRARFPHPTKSTVLTPGEPNLYLGALSKEWSADGTPATHKYTHGHALILSGGASRGGAARLAARGALRIGAGLVTVGCPPEALAENAARLDAVMLRPVADADAFERVLEDQRINALCLGPGLGTGGREVALVAVALGVAVGAPPPPSPPHEGEGSREAPGDAHKVGAVSLPLVGREEGRGASCAVVLDADALTILAREPDLFAALHENCVLTPHAGEFARLFPDIAKKLAAPATKGPAYSKVDATREASARAGCVVLYKGPDTVIADPTGRCSINSAHYDRAAPWLATAGSGDVLAGFITGLLARGFGPMQAAETAAWLHVECALKFGPGLIAEDLPEQLPAVFRDLGL
ncbi:NAD(P)H-hydrate epimerase [Defluviimonas sp. WL0050]|uniref:Bifunctional NAD(P)H-hydrate repair enzyme n=1 Tax=Albidovulum litorale TaxID=2984134 RepID=A0ABT2ZP12_9RHOB|nr:NAD(P)H-hydrate epimerase [Defluviimonas sp. WL0050]MCV2872874.1 NAD(P)H-hydrate epimerase [Defluviimonas sp. WL0050]